ncbi:MAG TPA: hypothetical protein VK465_17565, partial [Fibrobacteria bacterium]|nr:hypothetical protein [Fibrobacteria bacterium]
MGALATGLFNVEALEERARNLGSRNGLKRVFVDLPPGPQPPHAAVRVEFHNANGLAQIVADVGTNARTAADIFPLSGGVRLRAGTAPGQVRTVSVATGPDAASLILRIAPVGDYSTYTLEYVDPAADPLFARIPFKFRPGCFNLNCGPSLTRVEVPPEHPGLDYLARDYDSFRHILIQAMQQRVPGWEATSEADLDQVLIDLLAAEGDLLSDYQDRVMNEAYLATARKRVSLARHARLMDYHIHEGNQAATWLALRVLVDAVIAKDFGAWTGRRFSDPGSVVFATAAPVEVFTALNELRGYSWGGALDALEAGSTEADLALPAPLNPNLQSAADGFRDLLRGGKAPRLLIEQALNPETGTVNGRDSTARQVLRLLDGAAAAESVFDPAAGHWLVRARWQPEDALRRRYCLISRCAGSAPVEGITVFHGNLVQAFQGRPRRTTFRPPGADLLTADLNGFLQKDEAHWRPTPYGIACDLTASPLAYRDTPPGGEAQVRSTLEVKVSGFLAPWQERSDLIESNSDAPHFLVDTDEMRA